MNTFIFTLLAVFFLDFFLQLRWNPFYFRSGLRLFTAHIPAPAAARERTALNSLERDVAGLTPLTLRFRSMPDGSIAFRESFMPGATLRRYLPVMHGRIEVDTRRNEIRVIGLSHLIVLVLPPVLLFLVFLMPGTWPMLLVQVVFVIGYLLQRNAYRCVVEAIRRQLADPYPRHDLRDHRAPSQRSP